MTRGRLEAFSDGIMAVLITIMVLELKAPHGTDLRALQELGPGLCSYLLSFVFLGIYWNNHHHMFHTVERVDGRILWANLHLMFWLSLVPLTTAWMGDTHLASIPTACYGVVLLAAGLAYLVLQTTIIAAQGPGSRLAALLGPDLKGKLSAVLYLVAIAAAFVRPWLSAAIYVGVALMWLIPDPRIEKHL